MVGGLLKVPERSGADTPVMAHEVKSDRPVFQKTFAEFGAYA
jgi:hypothetical protein